MIGYRSHFRRGLTNVAGGKYILSREAKSESSFLDQSDMLDLTELLIMKNSICF